MAGKRICTPSAPRLSRAQVDYQVRRHLHAQASQWPSIDREAARARIRKAVVTGQAWLWPEPRQLTLFGGGRSA